MLNSDDFILTFCESQAPVYATPHPHPPEVLKVFQFCCTEFCKLLGHLGKSHYSTATWKQRRRIAAGRNTQTPRFLYLFKASFSRIASGKILAKESVTTV